MKNLIQTRTGFFKTWSVPCCMFFCFIFSIISTKGQTTGAKDSSLFYDSHFHLTNYIQEGIDINKFLEVMGVK